MKYWSLHPGAGIFHLRNDLANVLKKGGRLGTYFGDVIRAILKRFAAICSDFEAASPCALGRETDGSRKYWNIWFMGAQASASPLSIGIYWDCFGSVSIGAIYGIFLPGLTLGALAGE